MNAPSGGEPDTLVGVAVSHALDGATAVAEVAAALSPRDACFILLFVPEALDLAEIEAGLAAHLPGSPVFGCTTAGQITPEGYENDALLALSFPRSHFRCASQLIAPLKPLSIQRITTEARALAARFQHTAHWNRLALTISDGLSKQEDMLVAALEAGLDDMPIFGGSAANGLNFKQTSVLHGGKFHTNAALLLVLETDLEFSGIGFDHFLPTGHQMVVTGAEPEERVVYEINGAPAADEYARLVGVSREALSPEVFAENPVLVRNSALYHVRAIQEVHAGGALSFLSAIDEGLLLTLGKGQEIVKTMAQELDLRDGRGRAPEFILGFDCVLRRIEIDHKQLTRQASEVLRERRVLGFNTYGEQHCGVHVNQTFVGVAFFEPKARALH
ncbi:FIST signal transduction protein [Oceanicola sp. D3]|uniref:FIST N-terminal domain-containing protein n=1 Tax=Oceanicola sp. D3 TaxID=2587163 RepID=UPI00111E54D2|nr:FIST N-terminal domain-containing protein [Oceanicola sp. D3]QDC09870.1 FIST signal transduction protein [Oceanicola sp. D3]